MPLTTQHTQHIENKKLRVHNADGDALLEWTLEDDEDEK
jgi:hypothetical protein